MSKTINNLVIVESPAKASTIAGYLGPDFTVKSSVGHIRSIAKKPKGDQPPIDTDSDFATVYEIDPEKKKTVSELKKLAREAKTVWLATDEDREGEAIAWHLCEVLGLDPTKTNRIVFHEITKGAIDAAIKAPRTVDMSLVQAQQARQILDRLVGFELSPVVWRKVPGGKSAGRVQSPAVRLLVEREREIAAFESSFTFKVTGDFTKQGDSLKATLSAEFDDEASATAFLQSLDGANFTVSDIETKAASRNPLPPFTTSTLQQDANARLGYGARTTMSAAQSLYQAGFITYMRTDSLNLSAQALGQIGNYVTDTFGKEYHQVRKYKTKSSGAQEAHEAIRPTSISRETVDSDPRAQKLYDLIRRRTLASQMASAKLERTTATITISNHAETFIAKGEVVLFDGFLKVYGAAKDELLPPLTAGDQLTANQITARQTFARPPARYTEGSLVKKLEELGIGRPSTYATIINTIQTRGYAEKGDSEGMEREAIELTWPATAIASGEASSVAKAIISEKTGSTKGKLIPTSSGSVVSDFLGNHFANIVDYDFTAQVETELDEIAADKLDKTAMLRQFYDPFHQQIDQSKTIDRSQVAQARELGIDPKSGEIVLARVGRFGPMLQMGDNSDPAKKPRFANLPKGTTLETIQLDAALEMFKLPRLLGQTDDGQDIMANIGRFGPYIKVGSTFVSIKPLDPFDITLDQARELYAKKLADDADKNIAEFDNGIKILKGRYGPYITDGTKNAKIPKDREPSSITAEEAKELIAAAPDKPKRRRFSKK
ncbi:MAG: type I DNA topoisomerase [Sphaerimonospora mesophila]